MCTIKIAQESLVENSLPCELVVTAHTPCCPVSHSVVQTERPPIARFHHHRYMYHQWPKFKLRMPPALSQGRAVTVIADSGGATKPFNVLVGSEPAYLNVSL
jgi:hypothetical protein